MVRSSLGIYCAPGHDIGAALVRDGVLVSVIEEERLNRFKYGVPPHMRWLWRETNGRFGYMPFASITYGLQAAGMGIDDVDVVVLPEPRGFDGRAILPLRNPDRLICMSEPRGGSHHLAHAYSAMFASDFEQAAVLVVDGDGSESGGTYEAESGYFFDSRDGSYRDVFKNRYARGPILDGLGWMYEHVTNLIGFNSSTTRLAEPGKTMGLAPCGRPRDDLGGAWVEHDGWTLDFSGFRRWVTGAGYAEFVARLGAVPALRGPDGAPTGEAQDLAFRVQEELERQLLHLATQLHEASGAENLCLAGGVALNSVANGRLLRESPFSRVFVQPAAGDSGLAIGLAYYGYLHGRPPGAPAIQPIRSAYGGRVYPGAACDEAVRRSGLETCDFPDADAAAHAAAALLADGKIIGWFQGGSEYGPRALGNRSILADPRDPEMKDRLNRRVKFREAFRPFAPSVLAEHAGAVFELAAESPYMLLVADVRPEWRARVPAITHVDGSARIQTVDAASNPAYHRLISAFHDRTGVPLVLNTSFNLRGMPIVESPQDALDAFVLSGLDALFVGNRCVMPPGPERLTVRAVPAWTAARDGAGGRWMLRRSPDGGFGERREIDIQARLASCGIRRDGLGELTAGLLSSCQEETTIASVAERLSAPADGALLDTLAVIARQLGGIGAVTVSVAGRTP